MKANNIIIVAFLGNATIEYSLESVCGCVCVRVCVCVCVFAQYLCLFIKISNNMGNKNIILGNIYRPPRENLSNENIQLFINELTPVLADLNKFASDIVLACDYNIDLLKMQERLLFREYFENIIAYGLFPTLTLPTRVTDRSATLIDNIFSNVSDNRQHFSGILITNLSDHFPCFYQIKSNRRYNKSNKFIFCRNFNQENICKLYHNLESKDIYGLMDTDENADPNYNYNILENILITALNKYIPLQKVKFNKYKHKKCNWITTGILKSIKFRDNLYRRLKHTEINTEEFMILKRNLLTYNNILKQSIREAKLTFYKGKFENYRTDSKQTWKTINEVINKTNNKNIPDYIMINGEKITDTNDIVNHFNEYFATIGTNMADLVNLNKNISYKQYLGEQLGTTFTFHNIDVSQTSKILRELNSKTSFGHDGISTNLLKQLEPIIVGPLTLVINQSLNCGIFPEKFKLSKITPVYKKR